MTSKALALGSGGLGQNLVDADGVPVFTPGEDVSFESASSSPDIVDDSDSSGSAVYALSQQPSFASVVQVVVQGLYMRQGVTHDFVYDFGTNRVTFNAGAIPASGMWVQIRYR